MDQKFVEQMKEKLLEQKKQILESLAGQSADFRKIVEGVDTGDVVDIASDAIDRTMLESLSAQDVNRLQLIDSALDRIKQGKYGHCLKCNKEIPQARLEVIPYAFMCIECKSKEELRNR
jgi:DnaK suppressor protein